jgi:hypothetical protein
MGGNARESGIAIIGNGCAFHDSLYQHHELVIFVHGMDIYTKSRCPSRYLYEYACATASLVKG